jgi:hypothetical protein
MISTYDWISNASDLNLPRCIANSTYGVAKKKRVYFQSARGGCPLQSCFVDGYSHRVNVPLPGRLIGLNHVKLIGEALDLRFADDGNRRGGRNPYPHPRVVCARCDKIKGLQASNLKAMTRQVTEETGCKIETCRLDFFAFAPNVKIIVDIFRRCSLIASHSQLNVAFN